MNTGRGSPGDPYSPEPQYPARPPYPPQPGPGQEPLSPGQPVRVALPAVKPTVTYFLLGLTIAVYLMQVASQSLLGTDWPAALGVKSNQLIQQGQFWRLFTPMLLHGSVWHIGVNMYSLYILGPGVERYFGHKRFLLLYLLGGFAGNVLSFTLSPALSLGASTAIFGLLGAEGVFLYQNRELFGEMAKRALTGIIQVAVINLLIGLLPQVDMWGHVGGLLGGVMFAWMACPRFHLEGFHPDRKLVDERDDGDAGRATLVVGAIFAVLAAVVIFLRGGLL